MIFNSNSVLVHPISESKLKTFYIGFDLGICMMESFAELLMDTIVDFAFGYHTGILKQYDRRKLKEAAKSIYNIKTYADVKWTYVEQDTVIDDENLKAEDKIIKRGEFGELILHLILRDYLNTIPLLSKIYFKDTDGFTVHGFDAVHIGADLNDTTKSSLYLGESKIYYRKNGKAGEKGIENLIEDINVHFKCDFLTRECFLISKKKDAFISPEEYKDLNTHPEYEEFLRVKKFWFDVFDQVGNGMYKLQDLLSSVTIPLVCTYQSELFEKCPNDLHTDFQEEYEIEIRHLQNKFNEKLSALQNERGEPIKTDLNIILVLFPIPSKKELIKILHQKLYHQQHA
ncbi:MAG: DUF1837 domain-containing protein [Bacteroides sp.]|nr:DUF1837 domain-containing protein [Bacteroides sp.]